MGTTPVEFDNGYYERLIERYDYRSFQHAPPSDGLAGLGASELAIRYLCHSGLETYTALPTSRRMVTTGFGMSGPPHVGTICQMLGVLRLHQGGERCQIVLGDLDAHNGRGRSYRDVSELADRYRKFVLQLAGDPERLIVRSQDEALEVLRTMYLLGQRVRPHDFDDIEEDNHRFYVERGVASSSMTLGRSLSLLLMVADFAQIRMGGDVPLVQLGIDEHRYVRLADQLIRRDPQSDGIGLAAIYTRMIPGLNGHPKMSKSMPLSAIDVSMDRHDIHDALKRDVSRDPATSPTFQIACQLPIFSGDEALELAEACVADSSKWAATKLAIARYIEGVFRRW